MTREGHPDGCHPQQHLSELILGQTATEEGKTGLINMVVQVRAPPSSPPFHY